MSLDFVVLDARGAPESTVPISPALHGKLMASANSHDCYAFQCFAGYYEDTVVETNDLPNLLRQGQKLRTQVELKDLQGLLASLTGLIEHAIKAGKPLHAIAD